MLVNCPECGSRISDRAESCPQCGHPISASLARSPERSQDESVPKKDQPLLSGCVALLGLLLLIAGAVVFVGGMFDLDPFGLVDIFYVSGTLEDTDTILGLAFSLLIIAGVAMLLLAFALRVIWKLVR